MADLNLADYFAAHSPPVPSWFRHVSPDRPRLPDVGTYFTAADHRQNAVQWARDTGGYTFAEWLGDELELGGWDRDTVGRWNRDAGGYEKALGEWKRADEMASMVQWAFHYGRAMAAQSTKE